MISYRVATADDADAIADLHADSWRRHYRGAYPDEYLDGDLVSERRKVWRERFTDPKPNQIVHLALEDDDLVGFVCSYLDDDPTWGALIDNLHVRHDIQKRGVGEALMKLAAGDVTGPFYLWVLDDNANARRFYERLGARNVESRPIELNPSVRACRYVWAAASALGETSD